MKFVSAIAALTLIVAFMGNPTEETEVGADPTTESEMGTSPTTESEAPTTPGEDSDHL